MKLLNESTVKTIKSMLLEKFGEPVSKVTATVGITDDRSGKVATLGETEEALYEKAPPGMEDVVRALKKDKNVDNPYAVAWSMYNKKNKK